MRAPREQIYQAFFDLVSQAPGLVTFSRRLKPFTNVPAEEQPALFVEQVSEDAVYSGKGVPYKWDLTLFVILYDYVGDDYTSPYQQLNPIMDAIEKMLPANPPQTLGGLVSECRLMGQDHAVAGTTANQAYAVMAVRIITT
jgi:hypothetical protein